MKKTIIIASFLALLIGFFSFRLLDVPTGLTLDEADFGYNAALIANTGRDSHQRLTPFFVLSSSGTDWRQPFTQYYLVVLFKLFGSSVYLLRFSSVLIISASAIALYYLAKKLFGFGVAVLTSVVFTTIPIVMIQSHLALDNIMPIPFTIAWLWWNSNYLTTKNKKWLVLMGITLGFSLYTYKGMRAVAPIWMILTVLISLTDKKLGLKKFIENSIFFGLSVMPFYLIMPWLEQHYAGSVFGGSKPVFNNFYELFLPYLSSFDVSKLFIVGDIVPQHSTGIHGVYLLASAPWFITGVYCAIKNRNRITLMLVLAFFVGPLLFGMVGSVHRFSRLLMMTPIFSSITAIGLYEVWKLNKWYSKILVVGGMIVLIINFSDFVKNYWYEYPGITQSLNGTMLYYKDYEKAARLAKQQSLETVTDSNNNRGSGVSGLFFQVIYFGKVLPAVDDNYTPKKGQILITPRSEIPGLEQLNPSPVTLRYFVGN